MASSPIDINPIDVISASRARIARIAAIKAFVYFLFPALTALAMAALLDEIGSATWERLGYIAAPAAIAVVRAGLIAAGGIALALGAFRGRRAYAAAYDFVAAAEQIDRRMHAHEQVVTLATIADPQRPQAAAARSPLFGVLWRNVTASLSGFNPDTEFSADVREPLKRSSLPAAAIAVVLGVAMLALVRTPTPLQKTAIELRRLADKIEADSSAPESRTLADAARRAADDLMNPKLPPEQKQKELETILAEIDKHEQTGTQNGQSAAATGKGGSPSQNAAGEAQGSGQAQQGQASGPGKGANGTGQTASGSGQGEKKQGEKNNSATVELKNALAKAQAQVQTEEQTAKQTGAKPSPDQMAGNAPQPGPNPNEPGGNQKNENQKGSAAMPMPQAGAKDENRTPSGEGREPQKGGTLGDTHLGEFPAPANYQRFYQPGEKGAAVKIEDARYVVFRIPSASPLSGGGKTVIDTERLKASAPYTNAPLVTAADSAPPDEKQLVPPRYRDLIH